MQIYCYKIRRNVKKDILQSRFLVCFTNQFYYIECGYYNAYGFAPFDKYIVQPIDKDILSPSCTSDKINEYIEQHIKGKHEQSLFDQGRCTRDNIMWKRIELFLEYILKTNDKSTPIQSAESSLRNRTNRTKANHIYDTIDVTDIETESEFNFSDCSGDTIAEARSYICQKLYSALDLEFDATESKSEFKIWDWESKHDDAIYSDMIYYHKAIKKILQLTQLYSPYFPVLPIASLDSIAFSYLVPYTTTQLSQIRIEYWKSSEFYTVLNDLISDCYEPDQVDCK